MASSTDVREWARQEGIEVSARGGIKQDVLDRYNQAHPDLVQSPNGLDTAADDGSATEADYPPGPPPADGPGGSGERKPRPPATRSSARGGRLAGLIGRAKDTKPGKPARKPARIKLDSFAEGMWTDLAEVAPWPPLRTCLQFQGAYAAAVFDDVVAGTVIDGPMQRVARVEGKLRALDGLFGTPIFTAAICMGHEVETNPDGTVKYDAAGWPVFDQRTQLMFMGLKYSLRQMARIADLRIDEIEEKAAEIDARNAKVEAMVAAMFAGWRRPPGQQQPPADPAAPADAAAPAAAPQAAPNGRRPVPQPGFMYPAPKPMDQTGADPGRTS